MHRTSVPQESSFLMGLANDTPCSWKEQMEDRMRRLEAAVLQSNGSHNVIPNQVTTVDVPMNDQPRLISADQSTPSRQHSDRPGKVTLNLSCSLGAFPAASITDVTFVDDGLDPSVRPDLISCNVISLASAVDCFAFYKDYLDQYMHYLFSESDTLATVRARSSFLTVAICTVASFCTGSGEYEACLKVFTTEVSRKLFADKYVFDDVRALAIGALWLNDISSALNGLAVRIGTQLDLHRCITKMPFTKLECHDRTRLYFQVYLCDHHCSLIYGRPPMTTEFRSLKGPGAFLQSEFSSQTDLNLISQVEFWSINRRIYHLFGSDIESEIVNQRSIEFGRLNEALDKWREDWKEIVGMSPRIFDLYFSSAKLYLYSHVFRGPSLAQSPAGINGTENLAQHATDAALQVLHCAVDGTEDPSWLQKLPFYFGTMIAFACVCLIRTSLQESREESVRTSEIVLYLSRLSQILQSTAMDSSSSHPLANIAKSLESATKEREQPANADANAVNGEDTLDFGFDFDMFANNPFNLTFPGGEDNWMFCPDQIDTSQF
jgi:hypothetical protein